MDNVKGNFTRFEVIDHRKAAVEQGQQGRVHILYTDIPFSIQVDVQDNGRTIKVFVSDKKEE